MENTQVQVSVYCLAYNHEKFIKAALDGFVMQKTNFKFKVYVHDDASTDNTASVIKEYEEKYPDLICGVYQTENQYSKGIEIISAFLVPIMNSKYYAVCEGDDFWTDEYKLQKQYDIMEAHPELDMCAHGALREKDGSILDAITLSEKNRVLFADEVIFGGGGYFATNSLFYRSELDRNVPQFRQIFNYDYSLQIQGALRGGIYYLTDVMSVYRLSVSGSWTERMADQIEKKKIFLRKVRDMLRAVDEFTDGKYHTAVEDRIDADEFAMLRVDNNYKELRKPRFEKVWKSLPAKERVKIIIKGKFPRTVKFLKKFKRFR